MNSSSPKTRKRYNLLNDFILFLYNNCVQSREIVTTSSLPSPKEKTIKRRIFNITILPITIWREGKKLSTGKHHRKLHQIACQTSDDACIDMSASRSKKHDIERNSSQGNDIKELPRWMYVVSDSEKRIAKKGSVKKCKKYWRSSVRLLVCWWSGMVCMYDTHYFKNEREGGPAR